MKRHADETYVDADIVRRLLRAQFPQWADLPLAVVHDFGTDHTLFRLGDDMVVRMPIMEYATRQAKKEARWLPFLAPQVPLQLPTPLAMGEPGHGYPYRWSIATWIDGERATPDNVDLTQAAIDLAGFVKALQRCDPTDGPRAGAGTGYRGVSLKLWVERIDEWIAKLDGQFAEQVALWRDVVLEAPEWDRPPVWFHGDLPGNLIAKAGRLVGVIDSGYGTGDPACDLLPGWTFFRGESRQLFFDEVGLDEATITRARGFALAPAFIGVTYYKDVPELHANALRALEGALAD